MLYRRETSCYTAPMRNTMLRFWFGIFCLVALAGCGSSKAPAPSFDWRAAVTTLNYNDDDRDEDRRLAAVMLGVHRQSEATAMLIEHLERDADPKVRAACAFALGRIGGEQAVEALFKSLPNPSPLVRGEIVRALDGRLNAERAARLLAFAENSDGDTQLLTARVLAGAGFAKEAKSLKVDPVRMAVENEPRRLYVDATAGNDAAPGTSEQPVATIKQGLELLGPGDTLYVAGKAKEPLRETVVIPARLSGLPQQPTRLLAWPGKPRPVIQPTREYDAAAFRADEEGGYRLTVDETVYGVAIIQGSQVLSLTMPELDDEYADGVFTYDEQSKELRLTVKPDRGKFAGKVEVAFAPDGIVVEGANDVLISGFDVLYAPDSGLDAEHAYRVSFIDCSATHCLRHGIFTYYAPLATIDSCRADYCVYQGISVRTSPQTVISRCRATHNRTHGILLLYDTDDAVVLACESRLNFRQLSFIQGSDFGRVIKCRFDQPAAETIHYETGSLPGLVVE